MKVNLLMLNLAIIIFAPILRASTPLSDTLLTRPCIAKNGRCVVLNQHVLSDKQRLYSLLMEHRYSAELDVTEGFLQAPLNERSYIDMATFFAASLSDQGEIKFALADKVMNVEQTGAINMNKVKIQKAIGLYLHNKDINASLPLLGEVISDENADFEDRLFVLAVFIEIGYEKALTSELIMVLESQLDSPTWQSEYQLYNYEEVKQWLTNLQGKLQMDAVFEKVENGNGNKISVQ